MLFLVRVTDLDHRPASLLEVFPFSSSGQRGLTFVVSVLGVILPARLIFTSEFPGIQMVDCGLVVLLVIAP